MGDKYLSVYRSEYECGMRQGAVAAPLDRPYDLHHLLPVKRCFRLLKLHQGVRFFHQRNKVKRVYGKYAIAHLYCLFILLLGHQIQDFVLGVEDLVGAVLLVDRKADLQCDDIFLGKRTVVLLEPPQQLRIIIYAMRIFTFCEQRLEVTMVVELLPLGYCCPRRPDS